MLTWDSLTRGGRTRSLDTGVSPDTANSSTPYGYSPEVAFIFAANSSLTMFTTNSFIARTLTSVSLQGSRNDVVKHSTGGFALATVKKLNGARFAVPSGEMVETNAIGRGTTAPTSSLYVLIGAVVRGSMITLQSSSPNTLSTPRAPPPAARAKDSNRRASPHTRPSKSSASDWPAPSDAVRDGCRADAVSPSPA